MEMNTVSEKPFSNDAAYKCYPCVIQSDCARISYGRTAFTTLTSQIKHYFSAPCFDGIVEKSVTYLHFSDGVTTLLMGLFSLTYAVTYTRVSGPP